MRLEEIEARVAAATPGPWYHWPCDGGPEYSTVISIEVAANGPIGRSDQICRASEDGENAEDLDFIAFAREDIPALLAVAKAARQVDSVITRFGWNDVIRSVQRDPRYSGDCCMVMEDALRAVRDALAALDADA